MYLFLFFLSELSSQILFRRSKSAKIRTEPAFPYYIASYTSANGTKVSLEFRTQVLLGIRKFDEINYAIGIMDGEVICPMFDDNGLFIINMITLHKRPLVSAVGIPYGQRAQYTAPCIVSLPAAPDSVVLLDPRG